MIFLYERFTANKSQAHIYIGAVFTAADVEDRYSFGIRPDAETAFCRLFKGQ